VGDIIPESVGGLAQHTAGGWLMAALEHGQNIPQPIESSNDFSGKLVLRLPRSLHKKATWVAEREGVSLNHFIVASLAEAVGEWSAVKNVSVTYVKNAFEIMQFYLNQQAFNAATPATLQIPNFLLIGHNA
jgi:HicB family